MTTLFFIESNMNNASNAITELISNEIVYGFKMKNRLTMISKNLSEILIFASNNLKKNLDKTQLRFCQKTFDIVFFDNVKIKLIYDKKHKSLLLKKKHISNFTINTDFRRIIIVNYQISVVNFF